jgi:DNA/RNA endonuclease G (NUC1)
VSYPVLGTPPDAIAVPTHFFKVVLGEKRGRRGFGSAGFILPNKAIPDSKDIRDFQAPLEVIEKQAGLLFFDKVSQQLVLFRLPTSSVCINVKCAA